MKVVIVTAHWPPRLSGQGDHSWHLAIALRDRGEEVEVVVLGQDSADDLPDVRVSSVELPTSVAKLWRATNAIAARKGDAVLVQFEAYAMELRAIPHLLAAALLARRKFVVLTYHELWPPRRAARPAKLALLNAANRVVVSSKWHAEGVARFRRVGRAPDIIAVPTPVPSAPAGRALTRVRFAVPADVELIGFFAFIHPEHRVHEIISALAQLVHAGRRVQLSVVGEFQPETNSYHQRLLRDARAAGVDHMITWHGRVQSLLDVARLLVVCDVGVLPYDTGVGEINNAFAAFAQANVPVVTTRGERSRDMETEEIAVFCQPTATGLAHGIALLLDDRALSQRIAERAERWSARRDWERTGEAYALVLRDAPDQVDAR